MLNQGEAFGCSSCDGENSSAVLAGTAGWVCVELDAAAASPWHLLFCTLGVAGKPQGDVIGKKFQVFSFTDGKLRNQEVSSLIRKLDLACRAGVIYNSCFY